MSGSFFEDLAEFDPKFSAKIIFDVGANIGDVTGRLISNFPDSSIYAFEPGTGAYEVLEQKFGRSQRVRLHRIALDKRDGEGLFLDVGKQMGNHLVQAPIANTPTVSVPIMSGDSFCAKHGIDYIDFLKIDTEGYDLDVVAGFCSMLNEGRVKYVEVECTTNLDNRFHVHLERFIHFMHPFNYRVFGIYDFERKIYKTNQELNGSWFCDAVFVREVDKPRVRKDGKN